MVLCAGCASTGDQQSVILTTFTNFPKAVQYPKFSWPRSHPHSSCIFRFLRPTSLAVHWAERRLYGYFAYYHSSFLRTWNTGLPSVQGHGTGRQWRVLDLSDLRAGDYASGVAAGGAESVSGDWATI